MLINNFKKILDTAQNMESGNTIRIDVEYRRDVKDRVYISKVNPAFALLSLLTDKMEPDILFAIDGSVIWIRSLEEAAMEMLTFGDPTSLDRCRIFKGSDLNAIAKKVISDKVNKTIAENIGDLIKEAYEEGWAPEDIVVQKVLRKYINSTIIPKVNMELDTNLAKITLENAPARTNTIKSGLGMMESIRYNFIKNIVEDSFTDGCFDETRENFNKNYKLVDNFGKYFTPIESINEKAIDFIYKTRKFVDSEVESYKNSKDFHIQLRDILTLNIYARQNPLIIQEIIEKIAFMFLMFNSYTNETTRDYVIIHYYNKRKIKKMKISIDDFGSVSQQNTSNFARNLFEPDSEGICWVYLSQYKRGGKIKQVMIDYDSIVAVDVAGSVVEKEQFFVNY